MPSRVVLLLIGFLAFASVPGQQRPGGEQYRIAVNVDLVIFNVKVTDDRGRHVSGLKPADIQIHEDGQLQTLALFHAEDAPATVGLIIDNSGSMINKRAEVVTAALRFADAGGAEDEFFVIGFNERVYPGLPQPLRFTSNREQLRSALMASAPTGMTALYDALAAGIEHLKTGARDRKALVVFSDGGDNASVLSLEDILHLAQRSSATIYTIGIYDESNLDRNPGALRRIAQSSGGQAYFPDSMRDLDQVWRGIAAGIRSQYTIGYHSSNLRRDGAFRKVTITARRNGGKHLQVTTRDGYRAPSDTLQ